MIAPIREDTLRRPPARTHSRAMRRAHRLVLQTFFHRRRRAGDEHPLCRPWQVWTLVGWVGLVTVGAIVKLCLG